MFKIHFFIILTLVFFAGCNSEVAKLSPISKINADFSTGTATSFPGGLIVVGVRQDANEKVSFAFPDGNPGPIIMERGDWIFYSFGYSGTESPADLRSGKFAGLVECGISTVKIRGGERKSINLMLRSDGCSGKLAQDTKLQKVFVDSCPALSFFNNTAPYVFYPQGSGTVNACVNIPEDQNSNILFYKIFAVNSNNGIVTESFSSPCLDEVSLGTYPRNLPADIAPFKIKTYRSLASCEGDNIAHNTFYFPNGIINGNPLGFDSTYTENFIVGATKLFLPEAHTKRYHSPFLNNIPRFVCNTPDCFVSPTTDRTAAIEWDKPTKDQLIIPDINGNYTCDDFSHRSNFFGFSDCKIKNNSLYATVRRNRLTCQDTANATLVYVDLYERNGFIYVLYENGASTYVSVLTAEGQLINSIPIGAEVTYKSITATDSGDFYVSNPASGVVIPFTKSGTASWTPQASLSIADVSLMEITPDGKYLVYADEPSYDFTIYDVTNNVTTYSSGNLPQYIRKFQYLNDKLYVHITDNPASIASDIFRYAFSSGQLVYEADIANGGGTFLSFHIQNGLFHYLTTSYGVGTQTNYENAMGYLEMVSVNGPGPFTFSSTVDDFIVVNNVVYGILKENTGIYSLQWTGGQFETPSPTLDSCTESFSVLLGGQVAGSHKFVSNLLPDDTERALSIFEAADKLAGKKSADSKVYFKSLNEEQSRNTNGGILSLAQRLLGPHGVGGMLSEYADCNALRNSANLMPIYKTVGVTDPYRGYQSFTIQVSPNADTIPTFICHDGILFDPTCVNQYELKIKVDSTGLREKENYVLKMHCSSNVGQVDYRNTNADASWKQQLFWNTTLSTLSRADNYKMFESDEHDYYETSQVVTSGSNLRGRATRRDTWSDRDTATIFDYQLETSSNDHYSRKIYLEAADLYLPANAPFRVESDYSGVADYCLDATESSPSTPSVGICTFDNVSVNRVKQPIGGYTPDLSINTVDSRYWFSQLFLTFP